MPDSFDFILTENYPLKPVSGTSTHVAMRQGFSKQNINDTNQHFFTICGKNLFLVSGPLSPSSHSNILAKFRCHIFDSIFGKENTTPALRLTLHHHKLY